MPLSLNQPFLRGFFCHFPLLTPFLEVFAGLALDQLLKGFPHGFLPGELPHHDKTDFAFLILIFFQ